MDAGNLSVEEGKIQFSVLTTVFNMEEFLGECIESVLSQTHVDFELVIVDDQSIDDSFQIASSYAKLDPRIRVFRNRQNLGDYSNRNEAIRLARFEYLKFLDADDTLLPSALEVYQRAVLSTWEISPSYYFAVMNDELTSVRFKALTSERAYRRYYVERRRTFDAAPTSCLYRRSILHEDGVFEPLPQIGDFELAHRLSLTRPSVMIETPKPLANWRMHPKQQSMKIRQDLSIGSDYLRVSLKYLKFAESFFSLEERKRIDNRLCHMESQAIRSAIKRASLSQLIRVIRNLNFALHRVLRKSLRPFPLDR